MKSKYLSAAAIVLLTPVLAFAKGKNSADFQLNESVTVAGTQLAPGRYELTWEGSGPEVTVRFSKGAKTVATAPATLVSNPTHEEAFVTDTAADQSLTLEAIDLNHFAIQFQPNASRAGN